MIRYSATVARILQVPFEISFGGLSYKQRPQINLVTRNKEVSQLSVWAMFIVRVTQASVNGKKHQCYPGLVLCLATNPMDSINYSNTPTYIGDCVICR